MAKATFPTSDYINAFRRSVAEGFDRDSICGICGHPMADVASTQDGQPCSCGNPNCLGFGRALYPDTCPYCGDFWPFPSRDFAQPHDPLSPCRACAEASKHSAAAIEAKASLRNYKRESAWRLATAAIIGAAIFMFGQLAIWLISHAIQGSYN